MGFLDSPQDKARAYLNERGRRIGSYDSVFPEGDLLAVVGKEKDARFDMFLTHAFMKTSTISPLGYDFRTMQPKKELLGENITSICVHPPWVYAFMVGDERAIREMGREIVLNERDLQRGVYRVTYPSLFAKIMETHTGGRDDAPRS